MDSAKREPVHLTSSAEVRSIDYGTSGFLFANRIYAKWRAISRLQNNAAVELPVDCAIRSTVLSGPTESETASLFHELLSAQDRRVTTLAKVLLEVRPKAGQEPHIFGVNGIAADISSSFTSIGRHNVSSRSVQFVGIYLSVTANILISALHGWLVRYEAIIWENHARMDKQHIDGIVWDGFDYARDAVETQYLVYHVSTERRSYTDTSTGASQYNILVDQIWYPELSEREDVLSLWSEDLLLRIRLKDDLTGQVHEELLHLGTVQLDLALRANGKAGS